MPGKEEVLILRCSKCRDELTRQWDSIWGYLVTPCEKCLLPPHKIEFPVPSDEQMRKVFEKKPEKPEFVKTDIVWGKPPVLSCGIYPPLGEDETYNYELTSVYKDYRLVGFLYVGELEPYPCPIIPEAKFKNFPDDKDYVIKKATRALWQREENENN